MSNGANLRHSGYVRVSKSLFVVLAFMSDLRAVFGAIDKSEFSSASRFSSMTISVFGGVSRRVKISAGSTNGDVDYHLQALIFLMQQLAMRQRIFW